MDTTTNNTTDTDTSKYGKKLLSLIYNYISKGKLYKREIPELDVYFADILETKIITTGLDLDTVANHIFSNFNSYVQDFRMFKQKNKEEFYITIRQLKQRYQV